MPGNGLFASFFMAGFECASQVRRDGRRLDLLAANGVITLADGVAPTSATTGDIAENPKNLQFTELEAAQIPRSLADFAIAVVNGNYALEAGLNPSEEAIVIEEGEGNPNANMMVVRTADAENEALVKLDELLHSPEVKKHIEKTWPKGEVLPAF